MLLRLIVLSSPRIELTATMACARGSIIVRARRHLAWGRALAAVRSVSRVVEIAVAVVAASGEARVVEAGREGVTREVVGVAGPAWEGRAAALAWRRRAWRRRAWRRRALSRQLLASACRRRQPAGAGPLIEQVL